jgi:hypothetical protein
MRLTKPTKTAGTWVKGLVGKKKDTKKHREHEKGESWRKELGEHL